jgi:S-(hydroxymethyl)glutathione dehydrogenase/alcohol dehydrogenase
MYVQAVLPVGPHGRAAPVRAAVGPDRSGPIGFDPAMPRAEPAPGGDSMQVAAAVLTDYGSLGLEELELDPPGPGEVLVHLCASGVCHSDYHVWSGDLPLPTPMVLGHEGAGTVAAVGAGVQSVAVGDAVVLSWLPACGHCAHCLAGRPELCRVPALAAEHGTLPGGRTPFHRRDGEPVYQFSLTGTFAEYTVVPEAGCIRLPADTDLEAAALLGCSVLTGTGAVWRTAGLRPAESMAVFGAGGVGLNVLQGARLVAAHPRIAVDVRPERLEAARAFGATHVVDAAAGAPVDAILELTGGEGVDAAFEVVGRPDTMAQAFNATRAGGRTVLVGVAPPNAELQLNAFAFPSQERTLVGCWYGQSSPARDIPALLRLHRAGLLQLEALISQRFDLAHVADAFAAMVSGRVNRALVTFG